MVCPLCFDAEALASYVGAHDGLTPFYVDARCTKLAGDWAFLATDEGARSTDLQLDAFIATLRPSSP